jgi:hypothetical protein
MKALRRIIGAVLVVAAGVIVYDFGLRDSVIGQTLPLLLLLGGQVLVGVLVGQLVRSWSAIAVGPVAFVAVYLAAALLPSTGPLAGILLVAGDDTTVGELAGGSAVLGTIFLLTLLCSLLALGIAIGTTRGIRLQQHATPHRVRALPLEVAMADFAHIEHIEHIATVPAHDATPEPFELVHR